jgi:NhaP-type Na+/H+ or K+/H+ antiporter
MARRISASLALIVFAVCLVVGRFGAQNTFGTTVTRAVLAMLGTLVIGLVIGFMAERMLEENFKPRSENPENVSTTPGRDDR